MKYLVATGDPEGSAIKTEVVDITDPSKSCLLSDLPYINGAASCSLGSSPIICGGYAGSDDSYRDQCIVLGSSLTITMNEKRYYPSVVSLNSTTLWVVGGHYHDRLDSTEFISLNGDASYGPDIPVKMYAGCMVKNPEDDNIYILGGLGLSTNVFTSIWVVNPSDSFSISQGPSMNTARYNFGCGTMSPGSQQAIIAAGGTPEGFGDLSSVEVLIPSTANSIWLSGTYLC